MSVFHACCRCSWKTAALRYGMRGPEEYWLTAYAMDFLVRASEQG